MTTMSTPYAPTAPSYSTSDDTVRLPLVTDPRPAEYPALDHRALDTRPADRRPVLDATRLWTGGLATAAVAALVALVGTLVIRVLVEYAPVGTSTAHAIAGGNAGLLCLFAAVAALAATGVAHLLIVSTPDPLSYLGWIIGLSTAAAVVVPLLGGLPMAAAVAIATITSATGRARPAERRTEAPPRDPATREYGTRIVAVEPCGAEPIALDDRTATRPRTSGRCPGRFCRSAASRRRSSWSWPSPWARC